MNNCQFYSLIIAFVLSGKMGKLCCDKGAANKSIRMCFMYFVRAYLWIATAYSSS